MEKKFVAHDDFVLELNQHVKRLPKAPKALKKKSLKKKSLKKKVLKKKNGFKHKALKIQK